MSKGMELRRRTLILARQSSTLPEGGVSLPYPYSVHEWQAIICLKRLIKHLCQPVVTVHGLDTGIHAGMTAKLNVSEVELAINKKVRSVL